MYSRSSITIILSISLLISGIPITHAEGTISPSFMMFGCEALGGALHKFHIPYTSASAGAFSEIQEEGRLVRTFSHGFTDGRAPSLFGFHAWFWQIAEWIAGTKDEILTDPVLNLREFSAAIPNAFKNPKVYSVGDAYQGPYAEELKEVLHQIHRINPAIRLHIIEGELNPELKNKAKELHEFVQWTIEGDIFIHTNFLHKCSAENRLLRGILIALLHDAFERDLYEKYLWSEGSITPLHLQYFHDLSLRFGFSLDNTIQTNEQLLLIYEKAHTDLQEKYGVWTFFGRQQWLTSLIQNVGFLPHPSGIVSIDTLMVVLSTSPEAKVIDVESYTGLYFAELRTLWHQWKYKLGDVGILHSHSPLDVTTQQREHLVLLTKEGHVLIDEHYLQALVNDTNPLNIQLPEGTSNTPLERLQRGFLIALIHSYYCFLNINNLVRRNREPMAHEIDIFGAMANRLSLSLASTQPIEVSLEIIECLMSGQYEMARIEHLSRAT